MGLPVRLGNTGASGWRNGRGSSAGAAAGAVRGAATGAALGVVTGTATGAAREALLKGDHEKVDGGSSASRGGRSQQC
jgi:hypothetical protein